MGMSIRTLATVAMAVALVGPVGAQRSSRYPVMEETTVTRTLSFAATHPTTQSPRRGDPGA